MTLSAAGRARDDPRTFRMMNMIVSNSIVSPAPQCECLGVRRDGNSLCIVSSPLANFGAACGAAPVLQRFLIICTINSSWATPPRDAPRDRIRQRLLLALSRRASLSGHACALPCAPLPPPLRCFVGWRRGATVARLEAPFDCHAGALAEFDGSSPGSGARGGGDESGPCSRARSTAAAALRANMPR